MHSFGSRRRLRAAIYRAKLEKKTLICKLSSKENSTFLKVYCIINVKNVKNS